MREIPIIFNDEMVRAVLSGAKTQTRRPVKPQPHEVADVIAGPAGMQWTCPFGAPGDLLWVRECWANIGETSSPRIVYRADTDGERVRVDAPWRPSIHMPRWASRLTLRVTDVRVERLRDISAEDCIAEGLSTTLREHDACCALREDFASLWGAIYAPRGLGWDANPWVWVVGFEPVEADRG